MKERQIYYRKKDKHIIIEGKKDGNSVFIWTLPKPEILINLLIEKASFFEREKSLKILDKIKRLDYKPDKNNNKDIEVRLLNIKRNPEKDALGVNI